MRVGASFQSATDFLPSFPRSNSPGSDHSLPHSDSATRRPKPSGRPFGYLCLLHTPENQDPGQSTPASSGGLKNHHSASEYAALYSVPCCSFSPSFFFGLPPAMPKERERSKYREFMDVPFSGFIAASFARRTAIRDCRFPLYHPRQKTPCADCHSLGVSCHLLGMCRSAEGRPPHPSPASLFRGIGTLGEQGSNPARPLPHLPELNPADPRRTSPPSRRPGRPGNESIQSPGGSSAFLFLQDPLHRLVFRHESKRKRRHPRMSPFSFNLSSHSDHLPLMRRRRRTITPAPRANIRA